VRDFTISETSGAQNRGLYPGFAQPDTHLPGDAAIRTTLDNLTELGVTHVQLLPVQDFADNEADPTYNWGYIPMAYFSPEGMYATNPNNESRVREFKGLVDALHARGIGVIMDVVYNHTAPDAPFDSIVPGYYYRHLPDGSDANGSGCGNEFRTEAPMARKLILDSLAFWTREYGVDGYRFDLMALIDQETVREVEHELRAINPNIILFGEPWDAGASPLVAKSDKAAIRQLPVGAFNDSFRNALKGSPDGHDAGFIQNGSNREALESALLVSGWFASPAQSINYMTCHDNLVLWDKLKLSMPGAADALLVETMKLGYLALFTSQGVPFIQGGEEFARTKGGNNNSFDAPDSVNEVDWSLKRQHLDLFNYTRDVIALRRAHPVFRLRTREEVAGRLKIGHAGNEKVLMYTLDASGVPGESWKQVCVVFNSDDQANAEVTLPEGQWSVALDEHGAAANQAVSGQVRVRAKSGLVLYQP
jgi:pullulanase